MLYHELLSKRIYQLCDERNITINRLATLSEIKQSVIDKIVKGETKNPQILTLHSIALGFGISVDELLCFSEMKSVTFEDIRKYKSEIEEERAKKKSENNK